MMLFLYYVFLRIKNSVGTCPNKSWFKAYYPLFSSNSKHLLQVHIEQRRNCSPDNWPEYRYPGVGPIACPFAFDRDDGMYNPWPQVAGGIDGVACSTAKRKAYHPNQKSNWYSANRAQTYRAFGGDYLAPGHIKNNKNQHKCTDNLTDNVGSIITHGRTSTENRQ